MILSPPSPADIEHCRRLTKRFATNYYLATRFFPLGMRQATWMLYAFVRVPDEFVDTDHTRELDRARERIECWRAAWRAAYERGTSDDPVLRCNAWLFVRYAIPPEHAEVFLDAMLQDTVQARYATFADLDRYMYGSAQVVGLMMARIIGFRGAALEYACDLGTAFQLTNFLRDVREDYELRNRIYLPLDELERFGLAEDDIRGHVADDRWREFMRFQIQRTREYYARSDQGIPLLDAEGRRAVRAARSLYASILTRIEENGYDVYAKRARIPPWKKLFIVLRNLF